MKKVFIDGSEGTTGLRIFERFQVRDDIELLKIDSDKRKDPDEIKKFINASDITFLCLPDAAAREAVALCDNPDTVILDTSTAHRTEAGWAPSRTPLWTRRPFRSRCWSCPAAMWTT